MCLNSGLVARIRNMGRKMRAGGLVESHVGHDSLLTDEERRNAQAGTIEKLVRDQKIHRWQIVAQRAHRAHRQNPFHAKHLHRANIRAVIDVGRRIKVPATMPRQKCHPLPLQCANHDRVRRIAKGRFHSHFAGVGQTVHVIQTTAADNSDLYRLFFVSARRRRFLIRFWHAQSTFVGSASSAPSRSRKYAAGFLASCAKIASQPSFTASGIHFFLFSSVVIGYKS